MIPQHFLNSVRQLSLADRVALIEEISRGLRVDLEPLEAVTEVSAGEKTALSARLYGALKFDSEPPTDQEIKDERVAYLLEKYS